MTLAFKGEGDAILLVGETSGWLGQSLYLREICGREEGAPPPVDLAAERRHGEFVRALIRDGLLTAVHDVSDGGLLVALAEMAMASGIGAVLEAPPGVAGHAFWFGEDQGRYVVTAKNADAVVQRASAAAVPVVAAWRDRRRSPCRRRRTAAPGQGPRARVSRLGCPPIWRLRPEPKRRIDARAQPPHCGRDAAQAWARGGRRRNR